MQLPSTLEHCHQTIRRLLEENAALRQSGADFGHLAERLNAALTEERGRAAAHRSQNRARANRKLRWTAGEERVERWPVSVAGEQTCATPSHAAPGRHVRLAGPVPRPAPLKGFI